MAEGVCCYCGKTAELTIEHLTPVCRGGSRKHPANIDFSCSPCNHLKGPLTDAEYRAVMHDAGAAKQARDAMVLHFNRLANPRGEAPRKERVRWPNGVDLAPLRPAPDRLKQAIGDGPWDDPRSYI